MSIFGFVFDVFWVLVAVVLLCGFIYLAYAQGWFGVATRARGLLIIDALQRQDVKINAAIDKWQERVNAQAKAAKPAPTPGVTTVANQIDQISALQTLLEKGAITQKQFETMRAGIVE